MNVANRVIKLDIPQQVKVRKFNIDKNKLSSILRDKKRKSKLSNKQISNILNKPISLVEHWFRTDNCFSIPDEDSWFKLKKILNIEIDEFDEAITTFEYKTGTFEQGERHYLDIGISPTLTTLCNENKIIITK